MKSAAVHMVIYIIFLIAMLAASSGALFMTTRRLRAARESVAFLWDQVFDLTSFSLASVMSRDFSENTSAPLVETAVEIVGRPGENLFPWVLKILDDPDDLLSALQAAVSTRAGGASDDAQLKRATTRAVMKQILGAEKMTELRNEFYMACDLWEIGQRATPPQ